MCVILQPINVSCKAFSDQIKTVGTTSVTHMQVARPVNMVHVPPFWQYPSQHRSIGQRRGGYSRVVVGGLVMKTGTLLVGFATSLSRSTNSFTPIVALSDSIGYVNYLYVSVTVTDSLTVVTDEPTTISLKFILGLTTGADPGV